MCCARSAGLLDRVRHRGRGRAARPRAAALGEVDRVITRLQAVRLALVAEADRSEVAAESGLTGTGAWLAAQHRRDGGQAARDVRLATALDNDSPPPGRPGRRGGVHRARPGHRDRHRTAARRARRRRSASRSRPSLVRRAKLVDPGSPAPDGRRALAAAQRSQAEVDAHEDQVLRTRGGRCARQDAADLAPQRRRHHDAATSPCPRWLPRSSSRPSSRSPRRAGSPSGPPRLPRRPAPTDRRRGRRRRPGTPSAPRTATGRTATARRSSSSSSTCPPTRSPARSPPPSWSRSTTSSSRPRSARPTSTPARTSRPVRRADSPATPASSRPSSVVDRCRSISGGQDRFFTEPQRVALATTYDTCAARGRATGPMPGPSSITRIRGRPAVAPISRSRCRCADTITAESTTRATAHRIDTDAPREEVRHLRPAQLSWPRAGSFRRRAGRG